MSLYDRLPNCRHIFIEFNHYHALDQLFKKRGYTDNTAASKRLY